MNSGMSKNDSSGLSAVPSKARAEALTRIVGSEEFATSPKLGEFLAYVVNEQIQGRSDRIKGKTIAVDVFGRGADEGSAGHNIVRVEARRLRRLLNEYYSGSGSEDPIRLYIDAGGYVPRFEVLGETPHRDPNDEEERVPVAENLPPTAESKRNWRRPLILAGALTVLGFVAWSLIETPQSQQRRQLAEGATRLALRDYSVAALQAKDTAEEARALYFPVFDVRRQKIALDLYDYAIELAPELSDGHAGAAQVLATLHMLAQTPEEAEALIARAEHHADEAVRLSPSDAWALAAQGWVLAQSGDATAARQKVRIAVELAPNDSFILDLVGVTSIYTSDPELAAEVASRERDSPPSPGTRNIWGLANLMLGNDLETIAAFENAPLDGSVVSAPSLLFLAVALDRRGEFQRAKLISRELNDSFPDFPIEFVARRVFRNSPEIAEEIIERLKGLQAPD